MQSAPVCRYVLTLTDIETGNVTTVADANFENNISITVSTDELTTNRYYNLSLVAVNVAGTAASFEILSKALGMHLHFNYSNCGEGACI